MAAAWSEAHLATPLLLEDNVSLSDLEDAWAELVDELLTWAPRSASMIRPSVNEAGRVASELGFEAAPDLDHWFALHDGAGHSLAGGQLLGYNLVLGPQPAIETTRSIRETWAEQEPGETESTSGDVDTAGEVVGTWLDRYVLIGSDTMGGGWFVDLRTGPLHGCIRLGQRRSRRRRRRGVAERGASSASCHGRTANRDACQRIHRPRRQRCRPMGRR